MTCTTRATLEAHFGVDNIIKWADLNNNKDAGEITARINASITVACEEITARLRDGPYPVPINPVPITMQYLAATYAGIWLYSSRGVTDYDADGKAQDQLQHQRKEFDDKIRDILAGRYKPIAYPSKISTAPQVH